MRYAYQAYVILQFIEFARTCRPDKAFTRIRHKQRARCLRPTAFYTWTFNYEKQAADPQPAGFCTCLCLAAATGDIIFQISRSSQSKAIQLATHSDYSHTGMLVMRNKKALRF